MPAPTRELANQKPLAIQPLATAADEDSATGGPDPARGIWPIVATIDAEGFGRVADAELAERYAAIVAGGAS